MWKFTLPCGVNLQWKCCCLPSRDFQLVVMLVWDSLFAILLQRGPNTRAISCTSKKWMQQSEIGLENEVQAASFVKSAGKLPVLYLCKWGYKMLAQSQPWNRWLRGACRLCGPYEQSCLARTGLDLALNSKRNRCKAKKCALNNQRCPQTYWNEIISYF